MQKHYMSFLSRKKLFWRQKDFQEYPQLKGALENPLVSLKEKEHVIDRVFPQEMKNFLKVTCKYQKISSIYDILEAYGNYSRKQKGILKAVLTYVTKPEEAQKRRWKISFAGNLEQRK